jgi:hypothetical protein
MDGFFMILYLLSFVCALKFRGGGLHYRLAVLHDLRGRKWKAKSEGQ